LNFEITTAEAEMQTGQGIELKSVSEIDEYFNNLKHPNKKH
jgi:hypothetical protein